MGNFPAGPQHRGRRETCSRSPPSARDATAEEWTTILTSEIDRRFGEYDGDRLYHIGIAIDGYALAPPGVPLVLNPRSILVLSVNVWDDAAGVKLHEEPEQILVMEGGLDRDRRGRIGHRPHPRGTDAGAGPGNAAAVSSNGCSTIPNGSRWTPTRRPFRVAPETQPEPPEVRAGRHRRSKRPPATD